MSTIAIWFQKICLMGSIAAVALVAQPTGSAFALSPADTTTPPAPHPRLELAWAREQKMFNRVGKLFDHVDERIAKGQELIDKAKENGKDVTALQTALDVFATAIKQARPVYESGKGIVSAHQGFDASGNVIDSQQASQTIKDLRDTLKQVRDLTSVPAKALREAIKALRLANPPESSPTQTP
jgi:hypothetical protein